MMKRAMYQDLFEAIFKWMLAYCDEPRTIRRTDEHGDVEYVTFDRHDFLYQDEAGEWQYNTDFLFSCDSSAPLASDRQALWKETRMNFQEGAMGSPTEITTLLRFWEQMEKLHYPMAGDMVKSLRDQMECQQAQQANRRRRRRRTAPAAAAARNPRRRSCWRWRHSREGARWHEVPGVRSGDDDLQRHGERGRRQRYRLCVPEPAMCPVRPAAQEKKDAPAADDAAEA